MSYSKPEQIESIDSAVFDYSKPWRMRRRSKIRKALKLAIHRHDRQKSRADVEAESQYKKYHGYEY